MSIETYKEQINNPQILQQTIDELKLDEQEYPEEVSKV